MRVLLADHQTQVRSALRLLLEQEADLEVTAEVGEANGLLAAASASPVDLLLMDWHLPGVAPRVLLGELRQQCPALYIIVLSGRPESRQASLDAGADAFVCKGDPPETLLDALNRARASVDVPHHHDSL